MLKTENEKTKKDNGKIRNKGKEEGKSLCMKTRYVGLNISHIIGT
jgi:hypothetical protein